MWGSVSVFSAARRPRPGRVDERVSFPRLGRHPFLIQETDHPVVGGEWFGRSANALRPTSMVLTENGTVSPNAATISASVAP